MFAICEEALGPLGSTTECGVVGMYNKYTTTKRQDNEHNYALLKFLLSSRVSTVRTDGIIPFGCNGKWIFWLICVYNVHAGDWQIPTVVGQWLCGADRLAFSRSNQKFSPYNRVPDDVFFSLLYRWEKFLRIFLNIFIFFFFLPPSNIILLPKPNPTYLLGSCENKTYITSAPQRSYGINLNFYG